MKTLTTHMGDINERERYKSARELMFTIIGILLLFTKKHPGVFLFTLVEH